MLDGYIRRSNQDSVVQRKDQHDPSIFVFKEEFILTDRPTKLVVFHDNMGTLGAADKTRRQAQFLVCEIDPWSRGVDDELRVDIVCLIRELIAQENRVFTAADHADVIYGTRIC